MRRAAISVALLIAGCGAYAGHGLWSFVQAKRNLQLFDEALRLSIEAPDILLYGGGRIELSLRLANESAHVVNACLGPSRGVSVQFEDSSRSDSTGVDHPDCIRRFDLRPAAAFVWLETMEFPAAPSGPGVIEVTVEVLDPEHCSSIGCPATVVRASRTVMIR